MSASIPNALVALVVGLSLSPPELAPAPVEIEGGPSEPVSLEPFAGSDPVSVEPPAGSDPVPLEPPAFDPVALERALATLPAGPSLAEVQRAALRSAGIDPRLPARWRRRARGANAAPTLTVQYDQRLDRSWTLDQEAGSADALRNDGQNQSVLRIGASWELDRLIYSPEELRVARASLDLDDARVRVLTEVTALYFERQRLLLARTLEPPTDLQAALEAALRLREVEGLLAAFTGLEFSPAPIPPSFGPAP